MGEGRLSTNPKQRVKITYDKLTKKFDLYGLYRADDVLMPDGSKGRRITVDARDVGRLPKIIERERKRHGVPPLTPEQLAAEVIRFQEHSETITNPLILLERSYSFAYVRHALIKIAYELACLWLGDDYLDDPSAADIRTALQKPNPESTDHLPAFVMPAEQCKVFDLWDFSKNEHVALAWSGTDGIAVAVRVFDIYSAIVWVTADASRYLSGETTEDKLRFLAIDPVTKSHKNSTLIDEFYQLASRRLAKRRPAAADT